VIDNDVLTLLFDHRYSCLWSCRIFQPPFSLHEPYSTLMPNLCIYRFHLQQKSNKRTIATLLSSSILFQIDILTLVECVSTYRKTYLFQVRRSFNRQRHAFSWILLHVENQGGIVGNLRGCFFGAIAATAPGFPEDFIRPHADRVYLAVRESVAAVRMVENLLTKGGSKASLCLL